MGNWKGKVGCTFLLVILFFRKFAKERNKRDKKLLKIPIPTPMMQIIGLSFLCCCPIGNIISAYYWRATRGDKIWIKIRKLIHLTDWKKKENEKKQKDKKELFSVTFMGCIWISLEVNLHWSPRSSRTFRKMTKRKQWQLEMFSHLMNPMMMTEDEWKDTLGILATQVQMVWIISRWTLQYFWI